ncbi:MAG: VOC family protein, partial [Candidatus Hinthialibacter sp.]
MTQAENLITFFRRKTKTHNGRDFGKAAAVLNLYRSLYNAENLFDLNDGASLMHITPRLTHIALRVKNIEASAAFYKKYAELEIVAQRQENKT